MSGDWQQIASSAAVAAASFVPNIVTGLVSGILSAWITYWLAFRRFRAEKWWERRADAYGHILEALHNSLEFEETHMRHVEAHSEVPPGKDSDLRKAAEAADNEIRRAANVGKLFLSSAALNRLTRFIDESRNNKSEDWIDYLLTERDLTSTCLDEFAQLAREDLGTIR